MYNSIRIFIIINICTIIYIIYVFIPLYYLLINIIINTLLMLLYMHIWISTPWYKTSMVSILQLIFFLSPVI